MAAAGRSRIWLRATLDTLSRNSDTAAAILYALKLWLALTHYCDDGQIEIDNSAPERALRAISLARHNYLFAGADSGGERAAYSLIGTAKLNGIDPEAWLRQYWPTSQNTPSTALTTSALELRWAVRRPCLILRFPAVSRLHELICACAQDGAAWLSITHNFLVYFRRLPIGKQSRYPALSLTVIHARERAEPVDRKRIEWKLITDLLVASRREAIEKLNWYAMRWKIETFIRKLTSSSACGWWTAR